MVVVSSKHLVTYGSMEEVDLDDWSSGERLVGYQCVEMGLMIMLQR